MKVPKNKNMLELAEPNFPIIQDQSQEYAQFRNEAMSELSPMLGGTALLAAREEKLAGITPPEQIIHDLPDAVEPVDVISPEEKARLYQEARNEVFLDTEPKVYLALAEKVVGQFDKDSSDYETVRGRKESIVSLMYAHAAISELDAAEDLRAQLDAEKRAYLPAFLGQPEQQDKLSNRNYRWAVDIPDTINAVLIAEASRWTDKEKVAHELIAKNTTERSWELEDGKILVDTAEDEEASFAAELDKVHAERAQQIQEGSEAYAMLQTFIDKGPDAVKATYDAVLASDDPKTRSNFVRALAEFAVGRNRKMLDDIIPGN